MNNTNNNDNNNERNLLLVDLIRWFNFFKKCHEIETAIPMQDEIKIKYRINNKIEPDITEREIIFSNEEKERYADSLQDSYIDSNQQYLHELHNKWIISTKEAIQKDIDTCNELYTLRNSLKIKKNISIVLAIVGAICLWLSIFIRNTLLVILLLLAAVSIISAVYLDRKFGKQYPIISKKHSDLYNKTINSKDEFEKNCEFERWLCFIAKIDDIYPCSKGNMIKKVNEQIENYKQYLNKYIPELIAIKQDILKETILPKHYITEQHVCCILSLVLDGRADTLKEGLNLYEEEVFRNTVIRSFDDLSRSINLIHDNIDNISSAIEYNNVNALELNNSITNRLDSIESATNFLSFNAASK